MKYKPTPSQQQLQLLLDYDPLTGKLHWKERGEDFFPNKFSAKRWNAKLAGREAFTSISLGYHQGRIFGNKFLAHRVIWKWVTDQEPVEVDHKDRNRSNNRWLNLREISRSHNICNSDGRVDNSSGVRGVFWEKSCSRWRAQIRIQGKTKHLGVFTTLEEAAEARRTAETLQGFYPTN